MKERAVSKNILPTTDGKSGEAVLPKNPTNGDPLTK